MGSPSKENKLLELFFNFSSRHWHFEEILKESGVSRSKANKWLSNFLKEGIIRRVKPRGRMPYFVGDFDNPAYRNRKRIFALTKFYKIGLLNHLMSLPKAKTVIIFGSFSRADWFEGSDIDLFILGDDEGFNRLAFRQKLHREIQVFTARNVHDLKKMGTDLIHNIASGILVKGNIDFLEVKLHDA